MYFLALGQSGNLWENAAYAGDQYGIENPTDDDIRRVIQSIARGEQDLAILSELSNEGTYLQTAEAGRGKLMLEYQEESLNAHYTATNTDLTAERVTSAFLGFLHGEKDWKAQFVWQKMNL